MRYLGYLSFLLIVLALTSPAAADAVVTLCQSDRQAGAGVNLATALQSGGLVTFNCGKASIQLSQTHSLQGHVRIDGGGNITLLDGGQTMFQSQQNSTIEVRNLIFQGAKSKIINTGIGTVSVMISGSQFLGCESPIGITNGDLDIEKSVFTNTAGRAVAVFNGLKISNTRFENTRGVAVFSGGPDSVTEVSDSTFSDNTGGALFVGLGNATDLNNVLDIKRSTFSGNGAKPETANGNPFGGIQLICNDGAKQCSATISNSTFSQNASADGGAIFISGAASVMIKGSEFTQNKAQNNGGAVFINNRNVATDLNLRHVVFSENAAQNGGGLYADVSALTGQIVTFAKNKAADSGGGLSTDAAVQITRGVFVDNVASNSGAAINLRDCDSGTVGCLRGQNSILANTLIIRNKAGKGALFGASVQFENATVADNIGAGIFATGNGWQSGSQGIFLHNTIISGNSAAGCQGSSAGVTYFRDGQQNLQFPQNSCLASIPTEDPRLDPLYLPVPGSPAFGNGDNAACLADPVAARDVYGKHRPQGDNCSIGAAEGDLEKEVADRTVGGPAWPGNLELGSGSGQNQSQSGGSGGTSSGKGGGTDCCCWFMCWRGRP